MANAKKEIILQLGKAEGIEFYSQFRTADDALPVFRDANPNLDFKDGYFKHFFNKIIVEKLLEDVTSEVYRDFTKYSTQVERPNLVPAVVTAVPKPPVVIRTFSTAEGMDSIPEAMFRTYSTNTTIDELHSEEGGAMAACTIVVVGGPGVGKSTVMYWSVSQYKANYPDAKIAVVSSEMEPEDLRYEARRKPWMHAIEFILTSEYEDSLKEALELIFLGGYDMIILDSFADICDKLRDFCGMTTSAAETWLLNLMKKAKGGANSNVLEEKVYTCVFAIQQQTKSGAFAGSNKLKHNTTAMLELRKEKNGDRYMVYTKNRRNGPLVGKRLFYKLGANNSLWFDIERWEREKMEIQGNDAIGQQQESLDQQALDQFDQLDAEAARRAAALLDQAQIQTDENGHPIIPTIPQAAEPSAAPETTGDDLGEGMTEADIYQDSISMQWVLDYPSGRTINAPTKEAVIEQATALSN